MGGGSSHAGDDISGQRKTVFTECLTRTWVYGAWQGRGVDELQGGWDVICLHIPNQLRMNNPYSLFPTPCSRLPDSQLPTLTHSSIAT